MTKPPTGVVEVTERGCDLVLVRMFDATAEDLWRSLTDSTELATWFGTWTGTPGAGSTVEVTMGFEEGATPADVYIERCDRPHHLAMEMVDDNGTWNLEVELFEAGGGTDLRFTQRALDTSMIGSVGPGWEFYLDMLIAARAGEPLPSFDDYYPAQKRYYEGLAARG